MSVSEVVSLWNQYIRPEGQKGKYLVSPSVTTAPTGIDQLQQFFDTCGGSDKCGVRASINLISRWLIPLDQCDAISLHYYGKKSSDLQQYVTKMHNTFNLPVWLTEFSCQGLSII